MLGGGVAEQQMPASHETHAKGEKCACDWQENPQRAEDRDDLQQDHQKSRAVGHELDFRLAESCPDCNRFEAHAVAGFQQVQRHRQAHARE